jgi:CheY-like chemotaxis protein
LTDVVMPGMTGPDLAQRLVAARPGLKVLFASGYASSSQFGQDVIDECGPMLNKPYTAASLIERVQDVLAA